MEERKKLFYDLSEPISEDDPPRIKRLKQSYKTERQGDFIGRLGILIFALGVLLKAIWG
jgi:hypothetical protein